MHKQYIRVPDSLDAELRKLQGSLIRDLLIDVSYATVVNVVLMAGLLAADRLGEEDWRTLRAFLVHQAGVPAVAGTGDAVLSRLTAARDGDDDHEG
ncbi:MAG: hypothetical protein WBF66_10110 [Dehalococcoidia bacterium]